MTKPKPVALTPVDEKQIFPPGIQVRTWDIILQRFYTVPKEVEFSSNYCLTNGYCNIAEFVKLGSKQKIQTSRRRTLENQLKSGVIN